MKEGLNTRIFLMVLLLLSFGVGGITLQAYRARQAGMA